MSSAKSGRPRARRRARGGLAPHEVLPTKAAQVESLVELKERALRLKPGFEEAASAFRKEARRLWRRGDRFGALDLADRFAKAFNVPYDGAADLLPLYLADTPFSANPRVERDLRVVTRSGDLELPIVELTIDLQFDAKEIERAIRNILVAARREWKAAGGVPFQARTQDIKRWESWLAIIEATDSRGLSIRQYLASRSDDSRDESYLYRLRKKAREFLRSNGHEKILPQLNADELARIAAASGPHPFSAYRKPPLEVEITEITPLPMSDPTKAPRGKQ